MNQLQHHHLARIVQLRHALEEYDGWRLNHRPPHVGEVGIIVDILEAPGLRKKYVLECSASDGTTIWLGDFDAEEIDAVD